MTSRSEQEEKAAKRVEKVRAAGWLSFAHLCLHCGQGETQMRMYTRLEDFPKAVNPLGGWREARWEKSAVDAWFRAHRRKN